MATASKRIVIVNIFGTLGYLSLIGQWLWLSVLVLPQLIEKSAVKDFLLPPEATPDTSLFEFHTPPLIATILALVITITVLAITAVVLVRLPANISKTGQKAGVKTAEKIIPLVTHHKKITAKEKRQLTIRTIRLLKFALILLPFLLLLLVPINPPALSYELVMLIGAFLALNSLLWFSIEYGLAKILKTDPLKIT